ncbi:MAG: nickel-dependent lactate racemase [Syntrophobacteraceae bacterium]|nr:nickel-dependent lactate racemase [Syntrophobacteraceae bacterium]
MDLLYGRKGLTIDLPDAVRAHVIRKHPMPLLPDPSGAVRQALEKPVGCPSLQELAKGKKNACILICDITRPVPNGLILPPLVESLTRAGIARKNILILVATGLHRPNEGEELAEVVGSPEILRSIRIENHFAKDREAHVDLGTTSGGIPIMIDRRFAEADLKIVTGLVEPHFMAGYSGGRKVVSPGVAYQDTILMFHRAKILEHCKAANCVIEGNPLHNEQMEIVRATGGVVAVNVVIDERRRLGFVNFGEVEASHALAVAFMRKHAEIRIPRRFKTIVTTSAGHPLDKTYYQTVKGMVGVMDILEPGGTIIIASECSEGMGSPEFAEAQRLLCEVGPERFMSLIEGRDKALIDEWETEMLLKPLRVGHIQLYSTGLSESERDHVFVEMVLSVEEAVAASVRAHGDTEIAMVPEGPYVIPLFGG